VDLDPIDATGTIADGTRMGAVELLVKDLDLMLAYYRDVLALDLIRVDGDTHVLGRGGIETMSLTPARDLPGRRRTDAGLYHTAILFDDKPGLAAAVARVAHSGLGRYVGSADHLVSEAIYFDDPEGNGVELYVDRDRENWRRNLEGKPLMGVEWLDVNRLLDEHLTEQEFAKPSAVASVGHVHLQVGDIPVARKFYAGVLGFDVIFDMGAALFVSAGGYHHHIGLNTWHSRGAGPRAAALGLGQMDIVLPTADDVEALRDRLRLAGVSAADDGATLTFPDPWGSQIRVRVDARTTREPARD